MTNQERMRQLLDQRQQQARQRDEQASSRHTNQVIRHRWRGPRRGGSMRGRRSGA